MQDMQWINVCYIWILITVGHIEIKKKDQTEDCIEAPKKMNESKKNGKEEKQCLSECERYNKIRLEGV